MVVDVSFVKVDHSFYWLILVGYDIINLAITH